MALATTLQIAQVTQFLAANARNKSSVYNWGYIKGVSILPYMLQICQENLSWANTYYANTPGFTASNNYTFSLIGAYYNQALNTVNLSSGGNIVNPSPVTSLVPYPITLTITAGQAGIKTITNPLWVTLQSVNTVVINQSIFQLGTGFSFSSITGTFDFTLGNYILQTNDIFTSFGFKPS